MARILTDQSKKNPALSCPIRVIRVPSSTTKPRTGPFLCYTAEN